jgi:inhibitor of KinA
MSDYPTYRMYGEHAILLDWPEKIDLDIHNQVFLYARFISENFPDEIVETAIAYQSLVVYLKTGIDTQLFIDTLMGRKIDVSEIVSEEKQLISIPVCYDPEFGPDINKIASTHNQTISEVIERHTAPHYKVYFLGFLPGFAYLGGLDQQLYTPRRNMPRPFIEKGSVGIGGTQTGIYPIDSPGGWNIIGKTPLHLFDAAQDPPSMINAGDYVKFEAINKSEFELLQIEVDAGTFKWRKEAHHD